MEKKFYEPEEDSDLLLQTAIKELGSSKQITSILEVGVGSGYVISNIQKKFPDKNYYGTDINIDAIEHTKNHLFKDIENFKVCNLIESFNDKKFDLILFNTPYLPLESGEEYSDLSMLDKAIYGGKKGYEIIEEFIRGLEKNLRNDSICIMVFSSLSNLDYIQKLSESLLLDFKILGKKETFFETIYSVRIKKSNTLIDLESKGLSGIKYYDRGKHSKIFISNYLDRKVIVKLSQPQHISKELFYLNKLQDYDFVPKIYLSSSDYVVMDFVKGTRIKEYIIDSDKDSILKVLDRVLECCYFLDSEKINKYEMTNPYKHILIQSNQQPKLIDFERSRISEKTKNTTQFLQYILRIEEILNLKKINISSNKIQEFSKQIRLNGPKKFSISDIIQ